MPRVIEFRAVDTPEVLGPDSPTGLQKIHRQTESSSRLISAGWSELHQIVN